MIKALIIGLLIGLLAFVTFGHIAEARGPIPVVIENCTPNTWVGMIRWLNRDHSDFEYVIGGRMGQAGSLNLELMPGDYAITHRDPISRTAGPLDVIEFREIKITVPTTILFGCEE